MGDITEIKISDNKKQLFTGDNMFFENIKGEFCIGYNIGEKIRDAIQSAKKSVKICAPYTSKTQLEYVFPDNASFMKKLKNILVVTCNNSIEKRNEHCPLEKMQAMAKLQKCEFVIYEDPYLKQESGISYENYLMLHTKMYLIDDTILFLSSGNFTRGGMSGNIEFYVKVDGCSSDWQDRALVDSVRIMFEKLKNNPKETLKVECCKLEDYDNVDTQKDSTESDNNDVPSQCSKQQ